MTDEPTATEETAQPDPDAEQAETPEQPGGENPTGPDATPDAADERDTTIAEQAEHIAELEARLARGASRGRRPSPAVSAYNAAMFQGQVDAWEAETGQHYYDEPEH